MTLPSGCGCYEDTGGFHPCAQHSGARTVAAPIVITPTITPTITVTPAAVGRGERTPDAWEWRWRETRKGVPSKWMKIAHEHEVESFRAEPAIEVRALYALPPDAGGEDGERDEADPVRPIDEFEVQAGEAVMGCFTLREHAGSLSRDELVRIADRLNDMIQGLRVKAKALASGGGDGERLGAGEVYVLCSAVRYQLGRQTYGSGYVVDEVIRLAPRLPEDQRIVILCDIEEALQRGLCSKTDAPEWLRAREALVAARRSATERNTEGQP